MDIIKRIATHLAECEAAPYKEMEPDAGPLLFACRDEIIAARACAEMMLQGTGQKIGEEWARRVMDQHSPPQWIPVSERLPDDGVEVLVCFKGEIDSIEIREFLGGLGGVTHWMPLPEPPEVK